MGSSWLVVQKNLEVGEVLAVDVSCIVALTTTVNVQIKNNGPVRRAVFGVSCCHYITFCFLFFLFVCSLKPDFVFVDVQSISSEFTI